MRKARSGPAVSPRLATFRAGKSQTGLGLTLSTQSSNVPFEQSSNVPFCGRGVAFAHSESRRYAPPRLHFGAPGDTLHGVGWEAPIAGRGHPAKPYWRMNPRGGRLERDEAGVAMG